MRPFAIYPGALDAATLGYWRFGEHGGRLDSLAGGPTLANYGAEALGDGYRFVRADGDYMDADYPDQPARGAVTLECWVREWSLPAGTTGVIGYYWLDANNYMGIYAVRDANPALSYITARLQVGGVMVGFARWYAADAVLSGSAPWHVAAVLDAPNRLSLYIDGVLRAEDTTDIVALPSGDYLLRLGRYGTGWTGYDLSAVLDEVRLSAAARYASTFGPARFAEGRRALARGPGAAAGLAAGVLA